MKDLTLLVMAAGMGSRYGGLKQIDQIGPNGQTLIDYSIYDAIQSGFTKVVFIIRREFESQFKLIISNKFINHIEIDFVYQELNNLPENCINPPSRTKPWGTGHAVLCAKNKIHGNFVVINGDDYYGRESFMLIADYYKKNNTFSMVVYKLENTLSINGPVTRGICNVQNNFLHSITETEGLQKNNSTITSSKKQNFKGDQPVSMNMWGFNYEIFNYIENGFIDFFIKEGENDSSEYLLPTIINDNLENKLFNIKIIESNSKWIGITYKEDKKYVHEELKKLIKLDIYNSPLFSIKP